MDSVDLVAWALGAGGPSFLLGERNPSVEGFANFDTITENVKKLKEIKTENAYVLAWICWETVLPRYMN